MNLDPTATACISFTDFEHGTRVYSARTKSVERNLLPISRRVDQYMIYLCAVAKVNLYQRSTIYILESIVHHQEKQPLLWKK